MTYLIRASREGSTLSRAAVTPKEAMGDILELTEAGYVLHITDASTGRELDVGDVAEDGLD